MAGKDNGPNSGELARRIEALERENQELREALGRCGLSPRVREAAATTTSKRFYGRIV